MRSRVGPNPVGWEFLLGEGETAGMFMCRPCEGNKRVVVYKIKRKALGEIKAASTFILDS